MSAVLDISQGFPVEGTRFEPPTKNQDNERERYVTILGSLIEPDTARERPWTKFGGIEIGNPCLKYSKHFVMKGRITPVLKDVYDWVTEDYWDKATGKDASYFERPIPAGYQSPALDESGRLSPIPKMMGKVALPGEQIESILNGNANIFKRSRRGVVEHKSLLGHPYRPQSLGNGVVTDPEIWKIQTSIFPKYPFLPILLDDIERLLVEAQAHTMLRSIVDDDLESLSQFREYARVTVENTHYTMRETAQKSETGYIPRYTGLDFVLLEQLGMARQDMNIRNEARASGDPELRDMFKRFIELQVEEKEAIKASRVSIETPEINESTMMAQPPEFGDAGQPGTSGISGQSGQVALVDEADVIHEVLADRSVASDVPEEIKIAMSQYPCVCGKSFDTPKGLTTHQTVHCDVFKAQK